MYAACHCAGLVRSRCQAALLVLHGERNRDTTGECRVQLALTDMGHADGASRDWGCVHCASVGRLRVATCGIGSIAGGQPRVSRPE